MLDKLPRIENSPHAPCWQQRQIAAQNSYLASIKSGRELVYVAPCAATPQRLEPSKLRETPARTSSLPPPPPLEPLDPLTINPDLSREG